MDNKTLNQKWFEVIEEYCTNTFLSTNGAESNEVLNQIINLPFKKPRIGAILPFGTPPFFQYCSLPKETETGSPIRRPMAIVKSELEITDHDIPAAKGIYAAIRSPNPVAWAPFQSEERGEDSLRGIDYQVAQLEKNLLAPAGDEKGVYLLPIVYGIVPFFIFLLTPKKSLVECYDSKFLRNALELIAQTASRYLQNHFENEILKPFARKGFNLGATKESLQQEINNACFESAIKYSSWTMSLPGHHLSEMNSQKMEAKQAVNKVRNFFKTFNLGSPDDILEVFQDLCQNQQLKVFFEEPHDPWNLDLQGRESKKKLLRDGLSELLSRIGSSHLSKTLLGFEEDTAQHEEQRKYSLLKAYLWTPKLINGDWEIPFGLICDWPLIVSIPVKGWTWKIDCKVTPCAECVGARCASDSDHVLCHFSNVRFRLKINPYAWVEALRKLIVVHLSNPAQAVSIELNLRGAFPETERECKISVEGENIIGDVEKCLEKNQGGWSGLRARIENGLNTRACSRRNEGLPETGDNPRKNEFIVSRNQLCIILR